MSNEIVINSSLTETRVALIENDTVVELYIERKKDRGIVGNIYRGKVVRVLPGMQAAFVDIGLERAAFLYVTDVFDEYTDIYIRKEDSIDEKDEAPEEVERPERPHSPPIEDILKEGQEILVQVSKEPIGTKGARITSHISLPGRYLVYLPTVDHIGISRRIENEEERTRLKELIERIRPKDAGYIIRTVSEGISESELKSDIKFLSKLWADVQKKNLKASATSLLHNDLNITLRAMRDLFTPSIDQVVIDNKVEYNNAKYFVKTLMPSLKSYVQHYDDSDEPIFDAYGIEVEIARALARKVWLKSGGYITIEITEALVAIDVNTGKYVGKANLEDTILRTNLEAVKEIAYQLRLRNIGGIIIIDFIDMEKEKNKEKVFNALSEALVKDRTKTNILKISELGLVEMTRKRVRENITRTLCEPCFYCEGKGFIKSNMTICYEIIREIKRDITSIKLSKVLVHVHPDIADLLYDEEYRLLEELEAYLKKKVIVKAKNNFHIEQYEIMGIP